MDFVHRSKLQSSDLVYLLKGPDRVGVSLHSSEEGNMSTFQNVVFSSGQIPELRVSFMF
jgi:hypothetical protein